MIAIVRNMKKKITKKTSTTSNIVIFLIVLFTFGYVLDSVFGLKDYSMIMKSDRMNVYQNQSLVGTFEVPAESLEVFDTGSIGIGIISLENYDLKNYDLNTLYTLEFVLDDHIIHEIQMLTPRLDHPEYLMITKEWFNFDGKPMVLYEHFHYFMFGQQFYDELLDLIHQK